MGKSLIIKGADFSTNGIMELVWYIDRCTATPSSGTLYNANLENGGWAYMAQDNALLQGKTINRIACIPSKAGIFNIYKASSLTGPVTLVDSVTFTNEQIGHKTEFAISEFTLGDNEYLVFGQANSAGGFKFWGNAVAQYNGFYSKVPSAPSDPITPGTNAYDLFISVGYESTI